MSEELELYQRGLIDVQSELQNVRRHCDKRCDEMQRSYDLLQEKYDHIIRIFLQTGHNQREELQNIFASERDLNTSSKLQNDVANVSEETTGIPSENNHASYSTNYDFTRIETENVGKEVINDSIGKIM